VAVEAAGEALTVAGKLSGSSFSPQPLPAILFHFYFNRAIIIFTMAILKQILRSYYCAIEVEMVLAGRGWGKGFNRFSPTPPRWRSIHHPD
jgi:hypothetical protein